MPDSDSPACHSQSAIRHAAKLARAELTEGERQAASRKIAARIFAADFFCNAESIACFIPMATEVDTWLVIRRAWKLKKRIFAPVVKKNSALRFRRLRETSELLPGKLGIPEPEFGEFISVNQLDLVLTPLVAFDAERNRIGMGGGYYDRTFSFLTDAGGSLKPLLIGLAFDCQHVEKITPNPWDIPLFRIITESDQQ